MEEEEEEKEEEKWRWRFPSLSAWVSGKSL